MTTFNMQHLIDFLRGFPPGTLIEQRFDRAAERWPTVTVSDLSEASRYILRQIEEEREQEERDKAEFAEMDEIMRDFPAGSNFAETVMMQAAVGNPLALKWQAILNSRSYRTQAALGVAAHEAHPDFVQTPDNAWHYTGPGKMPSTDALIDWFQMTYPDRARAIEAAD